jgi:prevent-host-death family protein
MVTRLSRGKASPPATMSAAEFKATCLELMDAVERTGRSIVVTKRGHPVAVLGPVRSARRSAFGFMKGRIKILGDIVAPIDVAWDADR